MREQTLRSPEHEAERSVMFSYIHMEVSAYNTESKNKLNHAIVIHLNCDKISLYRHRYLKTLDPKFYLEPRINSNLFVSWFQNDYIRWIHWNRFFNKRHYLLNHWGKENVGTANYVNHTQNMGMSAMEILRDYLFLGTSKFQIEWWSDI